MSRCPFLRHGKCTAGIEGLIDNKCPWFSYGNIFYDNTFITKELLGTAQEIASDCIQKIEDTKFLSEKEKKEVEDFIKNKKMILEANVV